MEQKGLGGQGDQPLLPHGRTESSMPDQEGHPGPTALLSCFQPIISTDFTIPSESGGREACYYLLLEEMEIKALRKQCLALRYQASKGNNCFPGLCWANRLTGAICFNPGTSSMEQGPSFPPLWQKYCIFKRLKYLFRVAKLVIG